MCPLDKLVLAVLLCKRSRTRHGHSSIIKQKGNMLLTTMYQKKKEKKKKKKKDGGPPI